MDCVEERTSELKFKRTVLQTRLIMSEVVRLYKKRGCSMIENYPPYDRSDGAICMALEL